MPPAPAADNGQTIFLFEGLQGWNSANQGEIIQPVLQWGPAEDGGGAYWAVASWYVTPTDAYFTTPVPVSAGQSLQGEIQYVPFMGPLPAGVHEYSISFAGSLAAQTQLTALPEIPQFECVTTLEAYNLAQAADYPNAQVTSFTGISIDLINSANQVVAPGLQWSTWGSGHRHRTAHRRRRQQHHEWRERHLPSRRCADVLLLLHRRRLLHDR